MVPLALEMKAVGRAILIVVPWSLVWALLHAGMGSLALAE